METYVEQVLTHLETGAPLSAEKRAFTIDFEKVRRVLLRDGWHNVYKTTEKDREGLAITIKNLRKKLDNPNPSTPYSDAEMVEKYSQYIPYPQHPRLQPKPFRRVMIEGVPWAVWNESRDPLPLLAEVMTPWNQILALDVEQPR